ncbi:MBL fold metallo-hydrolase [Pontibacillus yanchengensis]|uniref:MBL fold metallo-hydrolase n=2 Tax=Pontibacillus yanchengensis TaxID=462910 RepID=A0ACC7VJ58_9BACI|nr:MBL fold metallo-hydrolase [Pontibacillus yanchengensis]MYL32606.1 MBL fold metallo-hydrolase [Pontibacillus yanchengensis]MYL55001.1 MBL fold metallo-hydrolase [Pontibacillus yanchengensis]
MAVKSITNEELAKRVFSNEETFILDVRNTDEFDDWKIEGKNIHVINEPYFNLMEGIDPVMDQLPKDKDIITVCAKGGSSQMVAEQVMEAGFTDVFSLEEGMKGWSEHLEPVKIGDLKGGGSLYQFVRIGKGCLSYFVESDGEAAIIDTNRMTHFYENFAKEKNTTIKYLIDTHLHADHISGGKKLAEQVNGTYYLPPKDAEEVTFEYTSLEEGQDIAVGKTNIKVQPMYSPGHTIGSTSMIVDDTYLMTGDILFIESIGRPDLAGKADDWVGDLRETLYSRYKKLSEDLVVLPAHYSFVKEMGEGGEISGNLGELYKKNKGLQIQDEDEFRRMVTENLPPQPNAYEDIRKTNMGKINPDEEKQREMEVGPNRCAVHE